MQIGATALLPQLLAALGAVFTKAGVGKVIAQSISSVVPSGNIFYRNCYLRSWYGIIHYDYGKCICSIFSNNCRYRSSIYIKHGGNPAAIGALGMTAGYCGTLMTPMAANFNIVPASILEIKDKNVLLKQQLPRELDMLIIHIIFMLLLF